MQKDVLRLECRTFDHMQEQRKQECDRLAGVFIFILYYFFNNVRQWKSLEINYCPVKDSLIFIAKCKYLDSLTRLQRDSFLDSYLESQSRSLSHSAFFTTS